MALMLFTLSTKFCTFVTFILETHEIKHYHRKTDSKARHTVEPVNYSGSEMHRSLSSSAFFLSHFLLMNFAHS